MTKTAHFEVLGPKILAENDPKCRHNTNLGDACSIYIYFLIFLEELRIHTCVLGIVL